MLMLDLCCGLGKVNSGRRLNSFGAVCYACAMRDFDLCRERTR